MTGPALALIAEARRLGLSLRADADTIHYRPKDRMTPDLAARIKAHKPEVIAVLRSLNSDSSTADRRGGPETSAARPDGPTDAPARPARFASPRANRPAPPAADDVDVRLPVKWKLDQTDRAVLLELGIMPTPNVADLPLVWRQDYARMVKLMIGRGLHLERAEAVALMTVLRQMLASGELDGGETFDENA